MKKWKFYFLTLLLALSPYQTVFAQEQEKASSAFKDGYDNYVNMVRYLNRFTSKVWIPDDFIGFGAETGYLINSFIQAIFWVNKMIWYVCSEIYQQLSDPTKISSYIDIAIEAGAKVYASLSGTFGYASIVVLISYVVYIYFVENGSVGKLLMKFFFVYVVTTAMFTTYNGKYGLKHIYDRMNTITQEIATNSISNVSLSGTGSSSLSTIKESDAVIRKYFKVAVVEPYRNMNSTIQIDGQIGDERRTPSVSDISLNSLLDYDSGDNAFKVTIDDKGTKEGIEKYVGKGENIKQKRLSTAWGDKAMYAFASIFDTTVLGVVLDTFSVSSFGMRLLFLILCLLSGFVGLISLIPSFDNTLFNFLKKMFSAVLVSGLMSVVSLFVLWFYDLVSGVLSQIFFGNLFLEIIAKAVIFWYVWKKRDFILSILTANRITQTNSRFARRLSYRANAVRRRATRNAMKRLKTGAKTSKKVVGRKTGAIKQFSKGLVKEKVGEPMKRQMNRFNPMNKKDSKAKLLKDSVADTGRKLSGVKAGFQGKTLRLRSKGVKRSNTNERLRLNEEAKKKLASAKEKRSISLGYHQRKHNLETKKRLMQNREKKTVKPVNKPLPKPSASSGSKKATDTVKSTPSAIIVEEKKPRLNFRRRK